MTDQEKREQMRQVLADRMREITGDPLPRAKIEVTFDLPEGMNNGDVLNAVNAAFNMARAHESTKDWWSKVRVIAIRSRDV